MKRDGLTVQYAVIFKDRRKNIRAQVTFEYWDEAEDYMQMLPLRRGQSKEMIEWVLKDFGNDKRKWIYNFSIEERWRLICNSISTYFGER